MVQRQRDTLEGEGDRGGGGGGGGSGVITGSGAILLHVCWKSDYQKHMMRVMASHALIMLLNQWVIAYLHCPALSCTVCTVMQYCHSAWFHVSIFK